MVVQHEYLSRSQQVLKFEDTRRSECFAGTIQLHYGSAAAPAALVGALAEQHAFEREANELTNILPVYYR